MPRFVVLEHDSPQGRHWDFMLEQEASLATWALPLPPDAAMEMPANRLPDHRLAYLDYEGPVSGNRGSVSRWDQGVYHIEQHTDELWLVTLQGQRLQGPVKLERIPEETSAWRLIRLP